MNPYRSVIKFTVWGEAFLIIIKLVCYLLKGIDKGSLIGNFEKKQVLLQHLRPLGDWDA
jgi:hypothetical protein